MNHETLLNVSPEFMEQLQQRSIKFGFSTVQDYLIHLGLVSLVLSSDKDPKSKRVPQSRFGSHRKKAKDVPPNTTRFELTESGVTNLASMMTDLRIKDFTIPLADLYSLKEIYQVLCKRSPIVRLDWEEMTEGNRDGLAIHFKYLVENSDTIFEKTDKSSPTDGYSMYKIFVPQDEV